jgi:hypothetical protein
MKTFIVSLTCLLTGLGIGWYIGYRHYQKQITSEAIEQMTQSVESSEALAALVSIKAIGLIETDDTQKAIQLLSIPIGNYYFFYRNAGTKNEHRAENLAQIEQLVRTNETVAEEINKRRRNYETPDKTN